VEVAAEGVVVVAVVVAVVGQERVLLRCMHPSSEAARRSGTLIPLTSSTSTSTSSSFLPQVEEQEQEGCTLILSSAFSSSNNNNNSKFSTAAAAWNAEPAGVPLAGGRAVVWRGVGMAHRQSRLRGTRTGSGCWLLPLRPERTTLAASTILAVAAAVVVEAEAEVVVAATGHLVFPGLVLGLGVEGWGRWIMGLTMLARCMVGVVAVVVVAVVVVFLCSISTSPSSCGGSPLRSTGPEPKVRCLQAAEEESLWTMPAASAAPVV
jgi:hypothetical protein